MTESKYFRGSNFCLLATSALLAWAPTLPLFTNGSMQSALAQDDPIEPPPAETPRNPSATPGKNEPAPSATPAPSEPAPIATPATNEPSPSEPDPIATPATNEPSPSEPAPIATPATNEPAPSEPDLAGTPRSGDDLLNSEQSQPAIPPSLSGGAEPVQALENARAAMAASQWRSAIDAWTTVLNANPANSEAKKGLQEAQAQLDQAGGSLLDKVSDDTTLRLQRLRVEFQNDCFSAGEKLNRGDYAGAQLDASSAKQLLDRDQTILSPSERESMTNRVGKLIDQINESRILGQTLQQSKQRADAQKSSNDAQRMAQQKRLETISDLLMRVRQLQMELKYDEALQVIDQILFMDPTNPAALALRDVLDSTKMYRQWSDAQRQRNAAFGELQMQDMIGAIPPKVNLHGKGPKSTNAIITYPEDWPVLSNANSQFPPVGVARTSADQSILKRMEQQQEYGTASSSGNQTKTFSDALDACLGKSNADGGIPFHVNWKALKAMDVLPDTGEIVYDGGNVSTHVMLDRILEQVGETVHPVWEVMDGQVVVTTLEALQNLPEAKRPRVYDLTDLVFKYPDTVTVPPLSVSGGGSGSGSGSGSSSSSSSGGAGGGFPMEPFITNGGKNGRVNDLKELIQKTVDPNSWGSDSSIEPFDTKLVITARPDMHRNIADLLQQLRADLALQINIEVRVLKIDTEWFEQIGLDFDMYFNTNNAQYENALQADPNFNLRDFFFQQGQGGDGAIGKLKNPVVFSGIGNPAAGNAVATGQAIGLPGTSPGTIQYQTGPVGVPVGVVKNGNTYANGEVSNGLSAVNVQQEGLPLVNALGAAGVKGVMGAAALANPAMTVGLTFLDDVQVDLLVRATQADQRNVLVTSPRLTMQNGQISFIAVTDQQSYVSGFTAPTTQGVTSTPQVSSISSGFSLGLQGVISADRRYVSLNVNFQLQGPIKFSPVTFQQSVSTASGSFNGTSSNSTNTFQTPEYQNTSIGTTITIPDKGTAVLGGQRLTTDFEVEVGVPVMSKIPVVNRFFTNRINSKTESTLLLLIRPEILIQQETEDALFPGLRNSLSGGNTDAGM